MKNLIKRVAKGESLRNNDGDRYCVYCGRIFFSDNDEKRHEENCITLEARRLLNGPDPIDHPPHYTAHPSGTECIDITEHMDFNLGNVIKYVWRADLKGNATEDLKKARFYINREINRLSE